MTASKYSFSAASLAMIAAAAACFSTVAAVTNSFCIAQQMNPPSPSPQSEPPAESKPNWNLPLKTLGGKQFWTDQVYWRGWRIQKNVLTGHHRLVDEQNVRQAWGDLSQCSKQLEIMRTERGDDATPRTRVIVLVHGLSRSRASLDQLKKFLTENSDYRVVDFGYASTRQSIAEHAKALRSVIDHLHGVEEINFVGHSLGNIVVRRYLYDLQATGHSADSGDRDRCADSRLGPPAFGAMVMLAPPNQGSEFARKLAKTGAFASVYGPSAKEISVDWSEFSKTLRTPDFPLGIIAGGHSSESWLQNYWVGGSDDLVLGVDETRLGGASDFVVVPVLHAVIMNDPQVHQYTLNFFRHHHFVAEDQRNPIDSLSPEATPDRAEHK